MRSGEVTSRRRFLDPITRSGGQRVSIMGPSWSQYSGTSHTRKGVLKEWPDPMTSAEKREEREPHVVDGDSVVTCLG